MAKNRELKPVSFNPENDTDVEILNYLEEKKIRFSSYVKQLILKDMNNENNNLDNVVDAINNLGDIIKNSTITVDNSIKKDAVLDEKISKNTDEDESKNIINNILNMH